MSLASAITPRRTPPPGRRRLEIAERAGVRRIDALIAELDRRRAKLADVERAWRVADHARDFRDPHCPGWPAFRRADRALIRAAERVGAAEVALGDAIRGRLDADDRGPAALARHARLFVAIAAEDTDDGRPRLLELRAGDRFADLDIVEGSVSISN